MPKLQKQTGFTIVELLVVIVVIGILAAITIVSYAGISAKATVASLQSDLAASAQQLKLARVYTGAYPATIDCSKAEDATNKCLRASPGSTYTDYVVDDSSNPQSFMLVEMKDGLYYSITDTAAPTLIESKYWKQISPGDSHTCAIASDSQAYCWGRGANGRLGNDSGADSYVPVPVSTSGVLSGKTLKSISSGSDHTCAVASDNMAYCWGYGWYGQMGSGINSGSNAVPVAVSTSGVLSGKTIKSISSAYEHTCAIASDDQAYCWGTNVDGRLGNNSTISSNAPVAVDTSGILSGKTIKSISGDTHHTCVIASDDQAYCWGDNNYGSLGNNSTTQSLVPVAVSTSGVLSGKTIKSLKVGGYTTCVIASDNLAYCWGNGSAGHLGNNSISNSLVPVAVNTSSALSGKTIKSITGGTGNHACVVASDNQSYCWGSNDYGQLGNNSTTQSLVPVAVSTSGVLSGKTIMSISGGGWNTCAITSEYQAYCWGYNAYGGLGDNSTTQRLVPVLVTPLSS